LFQEHVGAGIEEQCIEEHILGEPRRIPILLCPFKRHIPGIASLDLAPQEKLAQHAKRAVPERIARIPSPLGGIVHNLFQSLKPCPVRSKIVLKLNPTGCSIFAQGAGDREAVKNGGVAAL
jgi:hypothetical protein